jgi:hypothetical protein
MARCVYLYLGDSMSLISRSSAFDLALRFDSGSLNSYFSSDFQHRITSNLCAVCFFPTTDYSSLSLSSSASNSDYTHFDSLNWFFSLCFTPLQQFLTLDSSTLRSSCCSHSQHPNTILSCTDSTTIAILRL